MLHEWVPHSTAKDVESERPKVAVLPIGSFEQHGDYIPLATDTIIACEISTAIADHYPVFLLPPITMSCSHEHSAWPGTVSVSARTLYSLVMDIYESATQGPPSALVLVNAHGGNYILSNIVQEANATGKRMGLFPSKEDWLASREAAHLETSMHEDMHAGEVETSILLHVAPELVADGYETADHLATDRRHMLTLGLRAYTASGIVGRPSLASADKGKLLIQSLVAGFASTLELFE
jgi:creatinine amidohydrolase